MAGMWAVRHRARKPLSIDSSQGIRLTDFYGSFVPLYGTVAILKEDGRKGTLKGSGRLARTPRKDAGRKDAP